MPNAMLSKKDTPDKTLNPSPVFHRAVERYTTKVDTPPPLFHDSSQKKSQAPTTRETAIKPHPNAADKPAMGRFGLGTRLAMVVIGVIWCIGGAAWLRLLDVAGSDSSRLYGAAMLIVIAGALLIWTGLTPDRPKSFEEEKGELNPDLRGDHWSDFD